MTAGDQLIVGVHRPNGAYPRRVFGFTNRSVNSASGCLVAPATTPAAGNGLYRYTPSAALPTLSYDGSEYFISPDFTPGVAPPPPPPPPPPPVGRARLYADSVVPPSSVAIGPAYAVETGQRLNVACAGRITGIWWYRTSADTGVNTASLWQGSSLVAQASGDTGVSNGWAFLPFTTAVNVNAGDQFLLTVHHPNGAYARQVNGFTNRTVSAGCLSSPASQPSAGNGLYRYTASPALPSLNYADTEYFVGPAFTQTSTP